MNKRLSLLTAALLLTGASSAFAASSTDLTVTGLITPSSCTPLLSGNGIVDIGKVSAKDLNADKPTPIDLRIVQLTVNCEAQTLMAVHGIDNRTDSVVPGSGSFGLGLVNGDKHLGFYSIFLLNPLADGVAVKPIQSENGGASWSPAGTIDPGIYTSVSLDNGSNTPVAVKDLTMDLQVYTNINPTKDLDLTNEVPIDGSTTLEVVYL